MDIAIRVTGSLLFLAAVAALVVWWIRLVWRRGSKNLNHAPESAEATSGAHFGRI